VLSLKKRKKAPSFGIRGRPLFRGKGKRTTFIEEGKRREKVESCVGGGEKKESERQVERVKESTLSSSLLWKNRIIWRTLLKGERKSGSTRLFRISRGERREKKGRGRIVVGETVREREGGTGDTSTLIEGKSTRVYLVWENLPPLSERILPL